MSYASETALSNSMGKSGFALLDSTGTDQFTDNESCMVQANENSIISLGSLVGDSLDNVAFSAGINIVGRFASVIFHSGKGIAYKASLNKARYNYVLSDGIQVVFNSVPLVAY